jgi:hypothetical protein
MNLTGCLITGSTDLFVALNIEVAIEYDDQSYRFTYGRGVSLLL